MASQMGEIILFLATNEYENTDFYTSNHSYVVVMNKTLSLTELVDNDASSLNIVFIDILSAAIQSTGIQFSRTNIRLYTLYSE